MDLLAIAARVACPEVCEKAPEKTPTAAQLIMALLDRMEQLERSINYLRRILLTQLDMPEEERKQIARDIRTIQEIHRQCEVLWHKVKRDPENEELLKTPIP